MKKLAILLERIVLASLLIIGCLSLAGSMTPQQAFAAEGGGGGGDESGYYILDMDLLPNDPCPFTGQGCTKIIVTPQE